MKRKAVGLPHADRTYRGCCHGGIHVEERRDDVQRPQDRWLDEEKYRNAATALNRAPEK
jgi:hypothetical protein